MLPNVLCSVCADYTIYAVVCDEHFSLWYLLVVCGAPFVMHRGLMCLLLMRPESVVAHRLYYVISAPLSGDPSCISWLWVVIFFLVLCAPWCMSFLSRCILMLPSSLVHHSLDVFFACVLCFHACLVCTGDLYMPCCVLTVA